MNQTNNYAERFNFVDNQAFTFQKIFKDPIPRQSKHGAFHSYTVNLNGARVSFAAGDVLHDMIEKANIPVNGMFTVTKQVNGQDVNWVVNSDTAPQTQPHNHAPTLNASAQGGRVEIPRYEIDLENEYVSTHNRMSQIMPDGTDPDVLQKSVVSVFIAKHQLLMNAIRNREVSVDIPLSMEPVNETARQKDDLPF